MLKNQTLSKKMGKLITTILYLLSENEENHKQI
jgi:hypothetical protein